jgi:ferrochelatase
MRYWHPFTAEAIQQVRREHFDEIVLLPLYPQYSSTTSGSSLNEWRRLFRDDIPQHVVETFYENDQYLQALVEKVQEGLSRFPDPTRPELIFSAHSVPVAVITKGDPYQKQIEQTVELVMQRGGWSNRHRLCYQSKVGASKWLQPSLRDTVKTIAAEGIREACVVPISFVSDHVETLGEIDHEAREQAQALGITQFEMTAGLNDSPTFIRALTEKVLEVIPGSIQIPVAVTASSEIAVN